MNHLQVWQEWCQVSKQKLRMLTTRQEIITLIDTLMDNQPTVAVVRTDKPRANKPQIIILNLLKVEEQKGDLSDWIGWYPESQVMVSSLSIKDLTMPVQMINALLRDWTMSSRCLLTLAPPTFGNRMSTALIILSRVLEIHRGTLLVRETFLVTFLRISPPLLTSNRERSQWKAKTYKI